MSRKGEADLPNMAKFVDNKRSLFVSAQAKQTEKEKYASNVFFFLIVSVYSQHSYSSFLFIIYIFMIYHLFHRMNSGNICVSTIGA
jgi:hypothetical protein